MDNKLLKFKLDLFKSGKRLSRDVFLHMPLNGKMVRLALTGEELSEPLLLRLQSRGVASLFVGPLEGDTPEALSLFLEESPAVPTAPAGLPEATNVTVLAASPLPPSEDAAVVKGGLEAVVEMTAVSTDQPTENEESLGSKVKKKEEEEEEKVRISASPTETEVVKISALPSVAEEVMRSKASNDNEEVRISALPSAPEDVKRIEGTSKIEEAAHRRISALPASLQDAVRLTATATPLDPKNTILKNEEALETAIRKFEKTDESGSPSTNALMTGSNLLEESDQDAERNKQGNNERPYEQTVANASVDRDDAQVFTKDAKTSSIFQSSNARAAIYKELPAMAGRLATYLAHSLGYVSSAFLYDLALGVILYFNKVEGKNISDEDLPMLIQAILRKQHSDIDSSVEDSIEIVSLLEIYFQNPECDRTQKNFSERIFQETLIALRARPEKLNVWNEARWTQFITNGPTVSAHSLCSKATARAIKYSRELDL